MKKLKLDIQKFAGNVWEFSNGNMACQIAWVSWPVGSTATEKAQNNYSYVRAVLYVRRTDGYTTTGNFTGNININGTLFYFDTYKSVGNSWQQIGYAEIGRLDHNPDGRKTIYIGATATGPTETSWEGRTASYGENVSLDTIQRMSKLNEVTCIDNQQRTNNIEGTFNATYTRYNDEFIDNLVIEYLDRSDNSWNTIKTITNYVSETNFTFTQQELNTLFNYDTTQTTINLRFYLKTYSGETLIGDSDKSNYTYKIYDNAPVFSDFDFEDINTTVTALTGDDTINVNGYSNIKITITTSDKAVAQKGATMVKYRFVCGNQSTDIEYSSSASVNGTINSTENGTYQVYAIDSRGNSTPVTKLATDVINYTPITRDTNYSATRDDGGIGENVTITFSGNIWNNSFGSVSNGFKTAKYLLKKTDSPTWIDLGASMTNITPTITNNTYSFTGLIRSDNPDTTWDLESSYDIKIILEDKLSSVEFIMTLASATPNISLSKNGVGIMCDYDETLGGALQIAGEPYSAGAITNSYSTNTDEAYSCNFVNGLFGSKTIEDAGNNWKKVDLGFCRVYFKNGTYPSTTYAGNGWGFFTISFPTNFTFDTTKMSFFGDIYGYDTAILYNVAVANGATNVRVNWNNKYGGNVTTGAVFNLMIIDFS